MVTEIVNDLREIIFALKEILFELFILALFLFGIYKLLQKEVPKSKEKGKKKKSKTPRSHGLNGSEKAVSRVRGRQAIPFQLPPVPDQVLTPKRTRKRLPLSR